MTSMVNHAIILISFLIVIGAPSGNIIQVPHHLLHHRHLAWDKQRHNLMVSMSMTMAALTTLIRAPLVFEELSPLAVVA
jgi:hypothetical protein